MMSLHHGWGWQPTRTASCVHVRHIQNVWAYSCAVRGHMAVALNSYTHTGGFAQSAATSLLKNNDYFTQSFILRSPGDDSVTAISAAATKRWTHPPACRRPQPHASFSYRSKMPLPPPMPGSLLFVHGNPSSGPCPLLPPLPAVIPSLSSLPATACLYCSHSWLVVASFPAPSSTAHSVIRRSHNWHFCHQPPRHPLFDLHHPLFDCLPPSMVVIPPAIAFYPSTPLCPSCSLVWIQQWLRRSERGWGLQTRTPRTDTARRLWSHYNCQCKGCCWA